MIEIVLLRHGESIWNLENKFTGWVDVDLTKKGVDEAKESGKILKQYGYNFDIAYTSFLKRAQKTLKYCLSNFNAENITIKKDWRLNERHYGNLQGLNKKETAEKYGEKQVQVWRRSYNTPPPKLSTNRKSHPINDKKYKKINKDLLPSSESLHDVLIRVDTLWKNQMIKQVNLEKKLLIVAHGNSLRALSMKLNNISEEKIVDYNIPTGTPLIIQLTNDFKPIRSFFIGDEEIINSKIRNIANQGSLMNKETP